MQKCLFAVLVKFFKTDQKMDRLIIENVRIISQRGISAPSYVLVEEGKIVDLGIDYKHSKALAGNIENIDGKCGLLTPGLIDIHTHGIEHYGYENGLEALTKAARILPSHGTTCILPTIVPDPNSKDLLEHLALISCAIDQIEDVCIPGLHLEGPFVGVGGAACKPMKGDLKLLDAMLEACGGKVLAMSIAPEVSNIIAIIDRLIEVDVVPFITHTQATIEQAQAAIDAGARHATHFYDVFYPPERKDGGVHPAGAIEALLADDRCTVDFICDGVHVHPVVVKATLGAKGYENMILITDSGVGAGLPDGIYDSPWGFPVRVEYKNGIRNADPDHPGYGRLVGSSLTMNIGINNLMQWLDIPSHQIFAMGTANPARLMNLKNKGAIQPNADADLVLWEETESSLVPIQTWVSGKCIWKKDN